MGKAAHPLAVIKSPADNSGGQAARTLDGRGREYVTLSADHTPRDARIATLLLAAQRRCPLILIAGDGYALLPWDLGCTYAVLGWCVSQRLAGVTLD